MIVGGGIRIAYIGVSASCLITTDSVAKTLTSAIGAFGAEAPDAAFGVGGSLDLTLATVDTLLKLATVIDAYADYTCTVLFGEDVSPQDVISGQSQTHLAGALACTVFFNITTVAGDYCSQLDVTSEMQNIPPFTASTKPTVTEVVNWCGDISKDINAILESIGVSLPVTDADKLVILKMLAVWGVCARVLRSLEMQSDASQMYQDLYDKKVKQIIANPSIIASTETTSSGPTGYVPASTLERKFNRESDDW